VNLEKQERLRHRNGLLNWNDPQDNGRLNSNRRSFDLIATCHELKFVVEKLNFYSIEIVITLGILLRLYGLLSCREFWLDESMLLKNVRGVSPFKLFGTLTLEQVVPPGYLMMLRIINSLTGNHTIAMRLPSFLAATGAFLFFANFVKIKFSKQVALTALVLFAFNTDAVYYAQEMKPYAFDLLFSVILIMLLEKIQNQSVSNMNFCLRTRLLTTLAIMPWFSIPSVFMITAFFAILFMEKVKEPRIHRNIILIWSIWLISFLITWLIEKNQVAENSNLWVFWSFSFFSFMQPFNSACLMADNLINPMHLLTPLPFHGIMLVWISFISCILISGINSQIKSIRWLFFFGMTNILVVVIASTLRLYPFHGRTILFLLPLVLIVFAMGLNHYANYFGRWRFVFLTIILFTPVTGSYWIDPFAYHRVILFDGDLDHDYFLLKYGFLRTLPK
jgi:4-amino-4-deoxy-L-arabinose transferase-like glycosyltransferase